MQSFLGGDKAGSSNPLKKISQREGQDNSIFRDRFAPTSGSSSSSSAFRASPQIPHVQGQSSSNALHATPHPFNLSHLSAALAQPGPAIHAPGPVPGFEAQWETARSSPHSHSPVPFQQARPPPNQPMRIASPPAPQQVNSGWSNDFQSFNQSQSKGKGRAVEPVPQNQTQIPYSNGYSGYHPQPQPQVQYGGYGGYGGYQPSFTPMYGGIQHTQQHSAPQTHMQPQMNQKEMDVLFARAEEDYKASSTVNDSAADQQQANPAGVEEAKEAEVRGEPKGDFDAVWESLKPEAERLNKLAEWEKDFSQFTNNEDDLFDTLNDSLNRSDVGQANAQPRADTSTTAIPDGLQFDRTNGFAGLERDDGIPQSAGYQFASNNSHDSSELAALWNEANEIVNTGGSLTKAGLMLESFVQRSTAQDRQNIGVSATEAWSLLGRVHAMDEKEDQALKAFEEGRKTLGEEGIRGKEKIAGEMLTNLAISYVNESLDLAALTVLHQYLSLVHPNFAGQAPSRSSLNDESTSPWALHQSMSERFLNLARDQWQTNQSVDPDLQVGLGTLYYMMDNYEEARGCWTNALGEKPDDYLLWNRLGATLANGGNSEEAVDAYRRALELKPTFTRAIFNLGVACLNIGVYKESAEHLLAALSLHSTRTDENDSDVLSSDSWSIWSTLRRALVALNMNQLAGNAEPGADLNVFRQAGFEF
ncbi:uncharacterized protein I303_100391 [Kwoniella dejecticola CBS 10117]|uniref:Uncharacterized protein n=1 Tax=Kwoniella dejecticola CBS 10117 TaxID=1296121 RepID=A0A1A6AEU8_9TREE|nr:uncharacterized protein I303_00391 [Kwoniella dejecticola CBS 10117]OBR88574.1 hypothetical protein I303_00391 [Kwoniella dejecticola CBS 10117]